MEAAIPWILIGVAVLLVILAIVFVFMLKKKKTSPPDYYAFFMIGITWVPLGIIFKFYFLIVPGIIFLIVGLVNVKKWKQNRKTWDKLDSKEKKLKIIILVVLGILVLAGFIFFFMAEKGIL